MSEQTALAALEKVMIGGDLKELKPHERLQWYRTRCEIAGLDPRAQPFIYLELQGKLTLYATKAATDQLAAVRRISLDVLSHEVLAGEILMVKTRARDASGRAVDDVGAVPIGGEKGERLANAIKKAVTQSKRRACLSFCGLGMLDETEVDSIPGARRIEVNEHGEVLGELPEPAAPVHDLAYWRRRAMAVYTELGGDPANRDACRADLCGILGVEPRSRKELTAEEWQTCAREMERQRDERPEPAEPADAATEATDAPDVPQTALGWQQRAKAAMESGAGYAQQMGLG